MQELINVLQCHGKDAVEFRLDAQRGNLVRAERTARQIVPRKFRISEGQ